MPAHALGTLIVPPSPDRRPPEVSGDTEVSFQSPRSSTGCSTGPKAAKSISPACATGASRAMRSTNKGAKKAQDGQHDEGKQGALQVHLHRRFVGLGRIDQPQGLVRHGSTSTLRAASSVRTA
jgi:hypothetical protein